MRDFLVGICALAFMGGAAQDGKYETIKVQQNYEGVYGKITLQGVCKYSEDSVQCWDPQGAASAVLTGKMKDALLKNSYYGQISYGKKNRIAVFKVEPEKDAHGNQYNLSASSGGFEIGTDDPSDRYATVRIVETTEATEGTVRYSLNRSEPESGILKLAVGEQITYQGRTAKIEKIVKSDIGAADNRTRYVWTIFGKGSVGNWSRLLASKDGVSIPAVDINGNPAYVAFELIAPDARYSGMSPTPLKKYHYFRPYFGTGMNPYGYYDSGYPSAPNEFSISMNIDPTKVLGMKFQSWGSQTIEISGIPLDPK